MTEAQKTTLCTDTLKAILEQTGSTYQPALPEERARVLAAYRAFDGEFTAAEDNTEIVRIIAGHINTTFGLRHPASGVTYIVQRLNTIFDIDAIDNNLQLLEQAQARSADMLPAYWQPVGYLNVRETGRKIHYDTQGAAWRIMRYVPGRIRIFNTFSEVAPEMKERVACSQGEAIAVFGKMLDAISEDRWREPLPDFHNAHYHLNYLDAVLRGETVRLSLSRDASRTVHLQDDFRQRHAGRIARLCEQIDRRRGLATCLDALGHTVAHGDTKINNLIFREEDDGQLRCVCLIDLDTVQVGNRLDDLGDALRFAGNPAGEEPPSIDDVTIDTAIVTQITEGYLARVGAFYSPGDAREIGAHVRDAHKLFYYTQCLRFFADSLVGNAYFKLKAGQSEDLNLYRGEVQMRALERLEQLR